MAQNEPGPGLRASAKSLWSYLPLIPTVQVGRYTRPQCPMSWGEGLSGWPGRHPLLESAATTPRVLGPLVPISPTSARPSFIKPVNHQACPGHLIFMKDWVLLSGKQRWLVTNFSPLADAKASPHDAWFPCSRLWKWMRVVHNQRDEHAAAAAAAAAAAGRG